MRSTMTQGFGHVPFNLAYSGSFLLVFFNRSTRDSTGVVLQHLGYGSATVSLLLLFHCCCCCTLTRALAEGNHACVSTEKAQPPRERRDGATAEDVGSEKLEPQNFLEPHYLYAYD